MQDPDSKNDDERKIIMKRLVMVALLIGIIRLLCWDSAYAADIKIGVIDIKKIMRESSSAKRIRSGFLKEIEVKKDILRAKQKEVRTMEEELRGKGIDMAPPARAEKSEKISREIRELRRLRSDLQEELKKKDIDLTRRIIGNIREIAVEILRKESFTVILEKSSLMANDEAIDITDKIIRLYDTPK